MTSYSLDFPQGYEQYAWEVEAKGWFGEARLSYNGTSYRLNFYDPVRLSQVIDDEIERRGMFFEPNVVIVRSLTRLNMERAVAELVERGQTDSLIAE